MKKRISELLAVLLSFVMVISALPLTASAETSNNEITLNVENGADISDAFNRSALLAKYDQSGTVYKITIPAGKYYASKQLVLWSNTYVYMNGVTIIRNDGVNFLRFGRKDELEANPAKGYNGFSNIRIEGGTFDGNGYSNAIIQIGHSKNITFKGITFKNVKNAHMVEIGGCSDVSIENCAFTGFSGNWGSSTNYEALQFEVVTSTGKHFAGYPDVNDETPCRNITVKGCSFKNLQRATGTHTGIANSYFSNMNFINNTFENITGFALIATNYSNSTISGNVMKNCGSGIMFRSVELAHKNFYASKTHSNYHPSYVNLNSKILNNRISVSGGYVANYGNVAYGIQLNGENLTSAKGSVPKGDFRCAGVTVQGNVIDYSVTGYGIWLIGAVNNRINSNTVNVKISKKGKGGTGDGIRMEKSTSNTVYANAITDNSNNYASGMSGIALVSSPGNTLLSNVIKKTKKDGIRLDKSNSNALTSNNISGAKRDGIHLESSKSVKMTSNVISKSKRHGIAANKCKKLYILKNRITSCKGVGVNMSKKSVKKFKKNKIKKCKKKKSW